MDLNKLVSTVAAQMNQIAELQEQLKQKDKAQEDLIKRMDSMDIGIHAHGSQSQAKPKPSNPSPTAKPASKGKAKAFSPKSIPKTQSAAKGPRPLTSSAKFNTPSKSKNPKLNKASNLALTSGSKSSPKRNENQLLMSETPEGFKMTKVPLYCFIRLMWGMVEVGAVPPPPHIENVQEFTAAFSNNEQVRNVLESTNSRDLVPQSEVLTLRSMAVGRRKMGRYIINIQESFIKMTQACLAKLGIRAWGPNVLEPIDSLWNKACRLSALRIFRRVAIGGAFAYMNINTAYVENFELLEAAYNHYVHYVLAKNFNKEAKEKGKNVKDEEKKLRDARFKFAVKQGYKQRYLDIISQVDAHSDDKHNEKHCCYIVKTLEYRSANANAFFLRLDQEMARNDRIEGRRSQQRVRRRPNPPVMSTIGRPPRGMAVDFFDPAWFNNLSDAQKSRVADAYKVALLPNASLSFRAVSAEDEKLSDKAFVAKFWDKNAGFYDLSHEIGADEDDCDDDDEEEDPDYKEGIDLNDTSGDDDEDDEEGPEAEDLKEFVVKASGDEDEECDGNDDDYVFDEDKDDINMEVDGDLRMFEEEDDARNARQDAEEFDWNEWA
ncbi:hypothetical protein DFH28DRAFT_893531 [Melampsora americana]|nr:hypothetical protein DFH28DRAFT_893531 [Melampsora americana]